MNPRAGMTKADEDDLRLNWEKFCDADPFEGRDTFIERMEAAGFAELVPADDEALSDPFAAELGIEPGGYMWVLTELGRSTIKDTSL